MFNKEPCTRPMHETMATDPSFMVDMMKKNLTGESQLSCSNRPLAPCDGQGALRTIPIDMVPESLHT